MDWKRIMSKRHGKEKPDGAIAQNTAKKEEIQQYFVRLLPEINLRLLLDMESVPEEYEETERGDFRVPPARLLWVEDITVTAWQAALCMARSGKMGFIRTWKRFIKNKKERR